MPGDGGVGPRERRSPGLCQYCAALRPAAARQCAVFTACSKNGTPCAGGASVTAAPPRAVAVRTETGIPRRQNALDPGFHGVRAGPGAPRTRGPVLGERYGRGHHWLTRSVVVREAGPVGVALLQERVAALDRLVGHVRQPGGLGCEHLLADQAVVDEVERVLEHPLRGW